MSEFDYAAVADFDESAFAIIQEKMAALEETLPEPAIKSLAQEIVTRLAHSKASEANIRASMSRERIDEFVEVLVEGDADDAKTYIRVVLGEGVPLDRLYSGLLAGAAAELGARWNDDRLSFLEVTIATGTIYAIMRGLSPLFQVKRAITSKEAIFASLPGEDHTLGVVMAADIFRQSGWSIDLKVGLEHEELVTSCIKSDVLILGVSASAERLLYALTKLIIALRVARPDMFIMVAGVIVSDRPDILKISGADAVATDLDEAFAILDRQVAVAQG